jgi:hypothetical protein
MAKKTNTNVKQTSPRVASIASGVLSNPNSSAADRSAAASALAQARSPKKKDGK